MKAEEILESFLKYANVNAVNQNQAAQTQQSNLIYAPVQSSQSPPRTLNIPTDPTSTTNGNTISKSVKPTTNPSKGIKI